MELLTVKPRHQYIRRDGKITAPLEEINPGSGEWYPYPFLDREGMSTYDKNGHCLVAGIEVDQDLVAEFLDPAKQREAVVPVLDEYASAIWA